ncbi:MAG: integration host factor subunit beta [Desulfobacteraceae bacterium]|nr:integration host factor subunit beta [Desulfobacteraceae bacterium]
MNKQGLIQKLKKKCNITNYQASQIVNTFFNEISETLVRGEKTEIRGFCSFFVKSYKPYIGRNPKTGAKALVPAKKLPFFKCGKELKGVNCPKPQNFRRPYSNPYCACV